MQIARSKQKEKANITYKIQFTSKNQHSQETNCFKNYEFLKSKLEMANNYVKILNCI